MLGIRMGERTSNRPTDRCMPRRKRVATFPEFSGTAQGIRPLTVRTQLYDTTAQNSEASRSKCRESGTECVLPPAETSDKVGKCGSSNHAVSDDRGCGIAA